MLTGPLGMLASASLGDGYALHEPSHSSAPDIAGRGGQPVRRAAVGRAEIRDSLSMQQAADKLTSAIDGMPVEGGARAISPMGTPPERIAGTRAMGHLVAERSV